MIVGVNVKLIEESGVTPNEVFYLYRLKNGGSSTGAMCNMHYLKLEEYITDKYELTEKGKQFVDSIFMNIKITKKKSDTEIEDISKEFRELFPEGVKSGGLAVKSNIKNIEAKFHTFFNKYKDTYTKDVILGATKKYVNDKKRENYAFMQRAEYLIMKNSESSLATLCDSYMKNGEKEETTKSGWGRSLQ